jgi:DNA-binding response OmpR family regulator
VLYVENTGRDAGDVKAYFTDHTADVHVVHRDGAALDQLVRRRPEVVILDIGPPGRTGLDLCSAVRALSAVPIITVSSVARDAVDGLDAGADDFVPRPFSLRELLARVRSQARRARGGSGALSEMIRLGPLRMDPRSMSVSIGDTQIELTPIELECLHAFARSGGATLSREHLRETLYGPEARAGNLRAVDVVVYRLRQKLGDNLHRPRWIRAVRNVGYALLVHTPQSDLAVAVLPASEHDDQPPLRSWTRAALPTSDDIGDPQHVADAAHGSDPARPTSIVTQLLTQARDDHVDRPPELGPLRPVDRG